MSTFDPLTKLNDEQRKALGPHPDPQPGQRWSVTRAGVVVPGARAAGFRRLKIEGLGIIGLDVSVGEWTRLPDPEPDWTPGDLALDAEGVVWRKLSGEGWTIPGRPGYVVADGKPVRPLRRLEVQA